MKVVVPLVEETKQALDGDETIFMVAHGVGLSVLFLLSEHVVLVELDVFGADLAELEAFVLEPAEECSQVVEIIRDRFELEPKLDVLFVEFQNTP